MTSPMNDLRQASADVSGVEVLSDAALTVWCAFCRIVEDHVPPRLGIAAALRAAADQVVPDDCLDHQSNDSEWQTGFIDANCRIRAELLAIAAELEGAQ